MLEWFYARAGLDLPRLEQLKGHEVPAPYRTLLVHSSDMTPTLEGFFGESLGLTVLGREMQGDCYLREVLTLGLRRPRVLYGVIRIFLNHLPPNARKRVLEERFPLGHILETEAIPHLSWPQAFFRAEPDPHMAAVLGFLVTQLGQQLRCGSCRSDRLSVPGAHLPAGTDVVSFAYHGG